MNCCWLLLIVLFLAWFYYGYNSVVHHRVGKDCYLLTFDDGPSPYTLEILKLLDEYGEKAIFFDNGDKLDRYKDILLTIKNKGHIIGIHGYHHIDHSEVGYVEAYNSWKSTKDKIKEITGEDAIYYRPPYGKQHYLTYKAASDLGLKHVGWTVDFKDWETDKSVDELYMRGISTGLGGEEGDIILLHDGEGSHLTVPLLKKLLPNLTSLYSCK
jgi:peptidoglycan/xylan/chitin deacetylase (PgdA/CDA1 family)